MYPCRSVPDLACRSSFRRLRKAQLARGFAQSRRRGHRKHNSPLLVFPPLFRSSRRAGSSNLASPFRTCQVCAVDFVARTAAFLSSRCAISARPPTATGLCRRARSRRPKRRPRSSEEEAEQLDSAALRAVKDSLPACLRARLAALNARIREVEALIEGHSGEDFPLDLQEHAVHLTVKLRRVETAAREIPESRARTDAQQPPPPPAPREERPAAPAPAARQPPRGNAARSRRAWRLSRQARRQPELQLPPARRDRGQPADGYEPTHLDATKPGYWRSRVPVTTDGVFQRDHPRARSRLVYFTLAGPRAPARQYYRRPCWPKCALLRAFDPDVEETPHLCDRSVNRPLRV